MQRRLYFMAEGEIFSVRPDRLVNKQFIYPLSLFFLSSSGLSILRGCTLRRASIYDPALAITCGPNTVMFLMFLFLLFFFFFRFFVFVCLFFFQWRCPWCLMGLMVINLDLAHWKIVSSQVMSSNAHWWDDGEEENCAKIRYRYCDHGESTDFPPQVITGFQMFDVHLGEYTTCRPPNKIIDMFTKIWWFALRLHSRT